MAAIPVRSGASVTHLRPLSSLHFHDHGTSLLVLMVAVFRNCGLVYVLCLRQDREQQTK
jgi:hypothetical protein